MDEEPDIGRLYTGISAHYANHAVKVEAGAEMDRISRRMVIAGGAALSVASALAQPAGQTDNDPDIDQAIDDALKAHACPGISIAVSRAGTIIFSRGFGLANIETQTPVSECSIFRIGSLTKQFTAAAIIKLASVGRVGLATSVGTYLPALHSLKSLTLLELMHHTAGLHSDEDDRTTPAPATPRTQVQLAEEIARQTKPFDFDPGTAWRYSNANYIVLGAVIESVTRMPLARALSDLVFTPLHLTSTAMDLSSEVVPNRASGYTRTDNQAAPFENAAFIEVSEAGGAGAMRANAIDLCRWHNSLLEERLFDRAHIDLMLTPGRLRDGRLSSANRFSAEDAHYGDIEYACGLLISGFSDPNPSIIHYGNINGFSAALQSYEKSRVTFAVLCNSDAGPDLPFRAVRKHIVSHYLT
ncbi:MAG: serine hydrolase domain-containing protein [Aliidongia sp.]